MQKKKKKKKKKTKKKKTSFTNGNYFFTKFLLIHNYAQKATTHRDKGRFIHSALL